MNSFDPNIQFTYETEENSQLSFLDVMLCCKNSKLVCSVYRKSTNNDIYVNWHFFAPNTWKTRTLKSLIERTILICSTEELLNIDNNITVEEIEQKRHLLILPYQGD